MSQLHYLKALVKEVKVVFEVDVELVQGQQKSVSHKGNFSIKSSGSVQSHRSGQGGSTRSTFHHMPSCGTTSACSVCGRFHYGTCSNDDKDCFQCGQKGQIRRIVLQHNHHLVMHQHLEL